MSIIANNANANDTTKTINILSGIRNKHVMLLITAETTRPARLYAVIWILYRRNNRNNSFIIADRMYLLMQYQFRKKLSRSIEITRDPFSELREAKSKSLRRSVSSTYGGSRSGNYKWEMLDYTPRIYGSFTYRNCSNRVQKRCKNARFLSDVMNSESTLPYEMLYFVEGRWI